MKNNHACTKPNHYSKTAARKKEAVSQIDAAIKAVCNHFYLCPERCAAFECLVECLRFQTTLLRPTPGQTGPGWAGPLFLINRLRNLAERRSQWVRSPYEWRPTGQSLRLEFRALAVHLLGFYPVPGFMDAVWDLPPGPEAFRYQAWYIRLARGASFRELNLPLHLTRKMEHHIRHAPDHYTPMQALRYGETLGLGGNEKLGCEIAATRLGQGIEHWAFWRTVLQFFVNHPELDLALVNPIVEFIQANKFAGEPVVTAYGMARRQPLCPTFSIKGRTPGSMLRLVHQWNGELIARKAQGFSWPQSGIESFRFIDKGAGLETEREWSIHELLNSAELCLEGRALSHCVYTYALRCRRGQTTIWSLRLQVNGSQKRMATIEVDPRKGEIIQTRARANSFAGVRSRQLIEQWAGLAGLRVNARSW